MENRPSGCLQLLGYRTLCQDPGLFGSLVQPRLTYRHLGKYTDAEKLDIQVLDASNRILGVEHPDTIHAMANLASTYQHLGKYTDAEQLDITSPLSLRREDSFITLDLNEIFSVLTQNFAFLPRKLIFPMVRVSGSQGL